MMNPGWESVIESACQDLTLGGVIVVVDFHDSAFSIFKRWMRLNHVRLDGHLLPKLQDTFQPKTLNIHKAYAGIWEYVMFIGQKVHN
jgi:S-adenosylmethionine-diacylgycerolhomoserine-N-methlytransferase